MKLLPTSLALASFLIVVGCRNPGNNQSLTPLQAFADSLFQTSVDSSYIAGAAVIVYQKGEVLLDKSYGYASLELSVPMPENPSFEIGSVTKQFTAAAILRLVSEGKLSLEDDFTQYLEFETKGRTVTIGQLLNHTSGIPSYTEMEEFWNMSVLQFERDSLVRLVESKDFLFEPGEALIYNNSAYFFLGLIIEEVSGKTYEEYLQEQFFSPLGMNDTYYCSTSEIFPGKVYGYGYTGKGLTQKAYLDHTWPYAAGSLCSTTTDLLVWMRALHEGRVFDEQQYQLITTPQSLNDGTEVRYAMGLTNSLNFGNREIGHGGGINGFLSSTRYFPDHDLYVVCLVNTTGPKGAGLFSSEMAWKLLDRVEYAIKDVDVDLESLAGKYTGQVRGRILSVSVSSLAESIVLSIEGRDDADTLTTYVGNATWMDGNEILTFDDNVLRIDQVSGYYLLEKE